MEILDFLCTTTLGLILLLFSGEYPTGSCVPSLGQDLGLTAGSTLHLQSHLESHDQLQSYQSYHLHHQQQQQQHYPSMTGDFSNYGPIYGSSAYSNYVKCRTNPYQRPSPPPPHAASSMPLYYPGKEKSAIKSSRRQVF